MLLSSIGGDADVPSWALAHLANTTQLSVCGGNVALCQITLTTCSVFLSLFSSVEWNLIVLKHIVAIYWLILLQFSHFLSVIGS